MTLSPKEQNDRERVGKILFARRRIQHLNKWGCNVYIQSVINIIDDILPTGINKEELKNVRKRKNIDGYKDGDSGTS